MTSTHLVSMDISSEEVNNNNQEDKSTVINSSSVTKEVEEGSEASEPSPEASSEAGEAPSSSEGAFAIYSLNDNINGSLRVKVTSAEEWLCVARMPRDFSQTEFESLLKQFGPIQQSSIIHSDISGIVFFLLLVHVVCHWYPVDFQFVSKLLVTLHSAAFPTLAVLGVTHPFVQQKPQK